MKTSPSNHPAPPPRPRVDKQAYLTWVTAFRSHLPQLAALTQFPYDLSVAARQAFLLYPTASNHAPAVGRYYAAPAESVSTYRPPSMLKMFNALHDIVEYARAWCQADDARAAREAREAAIAKRKNTPTTIDTISDEEAAQSLAILRSAITDLTSPISINHNNAL